MDIQIRTRRKIPGLEPGMIKRKLNLVLEDLDCREGELSILFTDDRHMAEMNTRYLGKKGPTNVLAFPMSSDLDPDVVSGMLGDIVVSVDTAIQESKETGEDLPETIYRLVVHGLLHLLDYDHERSPREARRMGHKQKKLLTLMMKG